MKGKVKDILIVIKNKLKNKVFVIILCIFFITMIVYAAYVNLFNEYNYENSYSGDVGDINKESFLSSFIIDSFKKNGFITISNKKIYPAIIYKINNIKFDNNLIYYGKNFTVYMILYNGVFFQNCSVAGEVYNDNGLLSIRNIKIICNTKVYRENNIDNEIIKVVLLNEILNGGVFYLKNNDECIEEYIKPREDSIRDFFIKKYIIRNDDSIRAEVEGKIYMEKYKGEYIFDGVISIGGRLSDGNAGNSKRINIYDVPFDVY